MGLSLLPALYVDRLLGRTPLLAQRAWWVRKSEGDTVEPLSDSPSASICLVSAWRRRGGGWPFVWTTRSFQSTPGTQEVGMLSDDAVGGGRSSGGWDVGTGVLEAWTGFLRRMVSTAPSWVAAGTGGGCWKGESRGVSLEP